MFICPIFLNWPPLKLGHKIWGGGMTNYDGMDQPKEQRDT